MADTSTEESYDEDALFAKYLEHGKTFGYQDKKLEDYVAKQINAARDRHDRVLDRQSKKEIEIKRIEQESNSKKEIELEKVKQATKQKEIDAATKQKQIEQDALIKIEEQKSAQKKLEQEAQTAQKQIEEETKRMQLDVSIDSGPIPPPRKQAPKLPKLPNFKEKFDDIDAYLFTFEANATAQGFKKETWPLVLASHLEGTASSLYASLASAGSLTYEVLKENLCKQYRCTAEGYRKRFREAKPSADESFDIFFVNLKRLLDRWLTLAGIEKTFEGLLDMILSEQLMQSVCKDLKVFLTEKDLPSCQKQIESAEAYRNAHPDKNMARRSDTSQLFASVNVQEGEYAEEPYEDEEFAGSSQFYSGDRSRSYNRWSGRGQRAGRNVRRVRFASESQGRGQFSNRGFGQNHYNQSQNLYNQSQNRGGYSQPNYRSFEDRRSVSENHGSLPPQNQGFQSQQSQDDTKSICVFCNKPGHSILNCQFGPNSINARFCQVCKMHHVQGYCLVKQQSGMSCYEEGIIDPAIACCKVQHESVKDAREMETVCSSIQEFSGRLDFQSGLVNGSACSVLRDTGATVCGVRKRLVHDDQYTGETIRCVSFGGRVDEFPLARVVVDSKFISGEFVCCVLEAPVADLIVGNVPQASDVVTSEGSPIVSSCTIPRTQSKAVVEKQPSQLLLQAPAVTPKEMCARQTGDKSLSSRFRSVRKREIPFVPLPPIPEEDTSSIPVEDEACSSKGVVDFNSSIELPGLPQKVTCLNPVTSSSPDFPEKVVCSNPVTSSSPDFPEKVGYSDPMPSSSPGLSQKEAFSTSITPFSSVDQKREVVSGHSCIFVFVTCLELLIFQFCLLWTDSRSAGFTAISPFAQALFALVSDIDSVFSCFGEILLARQVLSLVIGSSQIGTV